MDLAPFAALESEVRGYVRSFPAVFDKAQGAEVWDEEGTRYLDFFAGAGTLNYGHNPGDLRDELIAYLHEGGIVHGLDMATVAKRRFLETFHEVVLARRGLDYKMQFMGPTGTNAVEAALKLARKVTGCETIVSFTNGFHGMTLGALAVTGNAFHRSGAGVTLPGAQRMPYDGYLGEDVDTLEVFRSMLEDSSSGVDKPAAVIVETIQGEGGVNVASKRWMKGLEALCRQHDILLIVDDIQVGCGRTGPFFSWEEMGIEPDMVTLSKSLSGYGLPFAMLLLKPELDQWKPSEHNGTFRGFNPAFVTATAALERWRDGRLSQDVERKGQVVRARLEEMVADTSGLDAEVRGRGLMLGVDCPPKGFAEAWSKRAFEAGLIIETSGSHSQVLKLLPPLTIDDAHLDEGLEVLERTLEEEAEARRQNGGLGPSRTEAEEVVA